MKKVLALMMLLAAVVAGCDTTETKTLRVNLGGSRAIPAGVSTVYVAAFPILSIWNGDGYDDNLGGVAAAAAVPAGSSSVSLVVPAEKDIFILVLAADSTGSAVFYVGDNIYVSADDNTVLIQMREPGFNSGDTFIYDSTSISSSDLGFRFDLVNGRIDMYDLVPYLELHLEESSDGGNSYNLIKRVPLSGFYQSQAVPFGVSSQGGFSYRARVYFPVLGLYFYNWGSYSAGT